MTLATAIEIAKVLLVISFVAVTISLVTYNVTATWWRTIMGRAIIIEQTTMWLVVGYLSVRLLVPGATPVWVSLLLYLLVAIGQLGFMLSIWWAYVAHRRLERSTNGQPQTN